MTNCAPFSIKIGPAVLRNVITIDGRPVNTFVSIGIKLPNKNVATVDASPSKAGVISCPSDRPPITLSAAAFIAANDPVNVVLASLAVVPVISNSL